MKYQGPEEIELELTFLQAQHNMDRVELLLYLANLLATGLLSTDVTLISKMMKQQTNKYIIRRLRSTIRSLERIGVLNVDSW